jgi:hypothetical protein
MCREDQDGRLARFCAALLLMLVAGSAPFQAQESDPDDIDYINYAFASQLGSGVYKVGDQTVQIYRIPISYSIRSAEDRPWGLKLRFPVTLGFYDFKARDIVGNGFPDDVSTLSIAGGVEFDFPITRHWNLRPIGEFGAAKDFSGGQQSYVYSAGLKSRAVFPWKKYEFIVGNKLVWAGQSAPSVILADDFAKLDSGFEVRHPLPLRIKGHVVDVGGFFENFIYFDTLQFLVAGEDPAQITLQYEVGVTFGTKGPWKLWLIRIPRIGVSYRFGDGLTAVRLVLGGPF